MDVLVISFVAALLAAWSDKTQLVTAMLAERTQRPLLVLAGLVLALAASNTIAGVAGTYVGHLINPRAATLLTILLLVIALSSFLFSYFYVRLEHNEWPPAGITTTELDPPTIAPSVSPWVQVQSEGRTSADAAAIESAATTTAERANPITARSAARPR